MVTGVLNVRRSSTQGLLDSADSGRRGRSPGPCMIANRANTCGFRAILQDLQKPRERDGFEPPVPVSKLSDDSIMLEFAADRRIALIAQRLQYVGVMRIPWRSNEKRFPLVQANVRKGDKMLVLGGVSHMVVELAKARGAEMVTTASAAKHSISCD
jgi:hypothetical protein